MTALLIVHVFVCVFLVCVILLQSGKADFGIGFGSSSQSIFGSKGAGNFLTKTTSVCAIVFLVTSFILTRARMMEYKQSVIKDEPVKEAPKQPTAPLTPVPDKQAPVNAVPPAPKK
ncbi:MAG: preprotein translocase subunit SecG [Deltaproteobacteria bacterium]|nr:preprotein translocase subunit SecG [Deltaproteobacteria bacterium]